MKKQTHPVSKPTVYSCGNCGTQIEAASTRPSEGTLDSCSNCHSAYTGEVAKQLLVGGRVESFNKRFNPR